MLSQRLGGDRGINGLQHLVHQTLLQRPAHSKSKCLQSTLLEERQQNSWVCLSSSQGSEVTEQVLHTVSKSSSLEEITLENTGLKS